MLTQGMANTITITIIIIMNIITATVLVLIKMSVKVHEVLTLLQFIRSYYLVLKINYFTLAS